VERRERERERRRRRRRNGSYNTLHLQLTIVTNTSGSPTSSSRWLRYLGFQHRYLLLFFFYIFRVSFSLFMFRSLSVCCGKNDFRFIRLKASASRRTPHLRLRLKRRKFQLSVYKKRLSTFFSRLASRRASRRALKPPFKTLLKLRTLSPFWT